jgi:hypothetical protein
VVDCARDLRGVADREQHSAVGVVDMKIERRPRQSFIYPQSHQIQCNQTERGTSMIDDHQQDDYLAEELVDLDKKIKQLRRSRANLSYDLEWCIRERDRIARHLRQSREEMHGRSS